MGNSKSTLPTGKDHIPEEAQQIMMEILLGKTADGDCFPTLTNQKAAEIQKRKSGNSSNNNQKRESQGNNLLRHSRLVSAYGNTRQVQGTGTGRQRRHTVKKAWAESLATQRTKEMKTEDGASFVLVQKSKSASALLGKKSKFAKPRRGTMMPTQRLSFGKVTRASKAA